MDPIQTRMTLLEWVERFMEAYPKEVTPEYQVEFPQDKRTLAVVFTESLGLVGAHFEDGEEETQPME